MNIFFRKSVSIFRLIAASAAGSCLLFSACSISSQDTSEHAASQPLEACTLSHTRVVWLQDAWEHNDVFSGMGQLRLMGLDSRDKRGERIILPGPAHFQKPLLTPCGEWVVFTDAALEYVCIVDWEGSERRKLAPGVALDLWAEPGSETVWVYTARSQTEDRGLAYGKIVRFRVDNPDTEEIVWDHSPPVGRDNFQLSADGAYAAGMFPWPHCGVANLEDGTWERHGNGCWTIMAPDNFRLMGFLDGAHRSLTLVDIRNGSRWSVSLAQAPGIDGHEVYHPRWSNHSRFMAMTGPYTIRHGGNNIRGGGDAVEIHIGRFSPDRRTIEAWAQVTSNEHANFFPDVWVADDDGLTWHIEDASRVSTPAQKEASDEILVNARLVETSTVPTPEDIAPYDRGLVANAYRIESVIRGDMPHENILAAHWVIRDGKMLPGAEREKGRLYTMRLLDYDSLPDLEGERITMDVEDVLMPLYYNAED